MDDKLVLVIFLVILIAVVLAFKCSSKEKYDNIGNVPQYFTRPTFQGQLDPRSRFDPNLSAQRYHVGGITNPSALATSTEAPMMPGETGVLNHLSGNEPTRERYGQVPPLFKTLDPTILSAPVPVNPSAGSSMVSLDSLPDRSPTKDAYRKKPVYETPVLPKPENIGVFGDPSDPSVFMVRAISARPLSGGVRRGGTSDMIRGTLRIKADAHQNWFSSRYNNADHPPGYFEVESMLTARDLEYQRKPSSLLSDI